MVTIIMCVCVRTCVCMHACVCVCARACVRVLALTEFDLSVHAEENVVTLDVSVDDLVSMQELQRLQTLDQQIEARVPSTHDRVTPLSVLHHITTKKMGVERLYSRPHCLYLRRHSLYIRLTATPLL